MKIKSMIRIIGVCSFLVLTGCGGGSGDSGGNNNDTPATWNDTTWDNMNWQ